MKLAISNIAWDLQEEKEVLEVLNEFGIVGLEVAPTKVCPNPEQASDEVLSNYLNYWNQKNIKIIAMQSLLFNKGNLSIFGEANDSTLAYLESVIYMASKLSAKALVFGSPKNRIVGNKNEKSAREEATVFFRKLGDAAYKNGVYVCIEANPKEYGCDFITSTLEGLHFVQDVDHAAVKLQIDTGTMFVNDEDPIKTLQTCLPFAGHFHISEPFLEQIGKNNHSKIASFLNKINYDGWVSIEMKNNLNSNNVGSIRCALEYVKKTYI
ncbi:tagatose 3-epimerase [Paenibacillus tyrfis]|uniref:sugar phosphate isomerase/epimerase family protein n=1 Tax=Paenibacillus tyrfis TaxID=1501230 RepID=UPI002492E14E|nr:sugar phosphate isomerase/epimerase [Paenibacillus tyrfis]GLI09888.1 tagatose 3-epimerase [Paenibacillus tyrfis]